MQTIKRISLALSKEDERQISELIKKFQESQSVVIKRAINYFYISNKEYKLIDKL